MLRKVESLQYVSRWDEQKPEPGGCNLKPQENNIQLTTSHPFLYIPTDIMAQLCYSYSCYFIGSLGGDLFVANQNKTLPAFLSLLFKKRQFELAQKPTPLDQVAERCLAPLFKGVPAPKRPPRFSTCDAEKFHPIHPQPRGMRSAILTIARPC